MKSTVAGDAAGHQEVGKDSPLKEHKRVRRAHTVLLSISSHSTLDYIVKLSHKRTSSLAKLSHINFVHHFQGNLVTSVRSSIL